VAALVVAPCLPTGAATYQVGSGGAYGSIQSAVEAAVLAGGDNLIKIATGTYEENVTIPTSMTSGSIVLSGGWTTLFDSRDLDPSLTVVDANGIGRPLSVEPIGSQVIVTVMNLTLQDGLVTASGSGGGVLIDVSGGTVTLESCVIRANTVAVSGTAHGGGIAAYLEGTASLLVDDCDIVDNWSLSTGSYASAGGIYMSVTEGAGAEIEDCRILGNDSEATGDDKNAYAGGIQLYHGSTGAVTVVGNTFRDNRIISYGVGNGSGGVIGDSSPLGGTTDIRANLWVDNQNLTAALASHVGVSAGADSAVSFTDSLIAGADGTGISVLAEDSATLRLTNITVADNGTYGVSFACYAAATCSLANSIIDGQSANVGLTGTVTTVGNLIGTTPPFVDRANRDYHLPGDAAAVDSGDPSPPGGLGSVDADGNPRVLNGAVDVGAYEWAGIFLDGFESGGTTQWSSSVH